MSAPFVGELTAFVERGGPVMIPLLAAAVALWYALGYRWFALRRGSWRSLARLIAFAEGGGLARRGVVPRAVALGVALRERSPTRLRPRLEEAFGALEDELDRFSTFVGAVVVVAPLTGLLGTVGGMIETFDALGDMSLFSQSGGVAGGVAEALISTQMGLAVAIPGLIVGRLLMRRQRALVRELTRLADRLCAPTPAAGPDRTPAPNPRHQGGTR